jgi:NAD+ kinase
VKIALYSRKRIKTNVETIKKVVHYLNEHHCELILHTHIFQELSKEHWETKPILFETQDDLKQLKDVDFMISIGGDGTLIDSANMVGNSGIPIVGINTGRIGFLACTPKDNFEPHLQRILQGNYGIEERSLLHLEWDAPLPLQSQFALNDITIRPSDETSINAIKVWLDNNPVNTYWADGLIIATPTGSTAYSLSCGGPILLPSTEVNAITPIASHTLAVRPIIVPATQKITISVDSRSKKYALALDSKRILVPNHVSLFITPEQFKIKMVRFAENDFFSIIREKLMWGVDWRNRQQ